MAVKSSPERPAARQPRPSAAPSRTTPPPRPPRSNERFIHDISGLALLALGPMLGVWLVLSRHGHAGLLGDWLVLGLRFVVGIGAWAFPALLCAVGLMLIQGKHRKTRTNFAGGAALLFLVGISWWHLGHTTRVTEFTDITEGGWLGAAVSGGLRALVGDISSHIVLFVFSIGAVVWATDMRLLHLFDHAVAGGRRVGAPIARSAKASAQAAQSGAAAIKERAAQRRIYTPEVKPTPAQAPSPPETGRAKVSDPPVGAGFTPALPTPGSTLPVPASALPLSAGPLPTVFEPAPAIRLAVTPRPPPVSEPLRPPETGGPLQSNLLRSKEAVPSLSSSPNPKRRLAPS